MSEPIKWPPAVKEAFARIVAKRQQDEYSNFISSIAWRTSRKGNHYTVDRGNVGTVYKSGDFFRWIINLGESDETIWGEEYFECENDAMESLLDNLFECRSLPDFYD